MIPLKEEQYKMLKDKTEVSVRFLQDQNKATASVETVKKARIILAI